MDISQCVLITAEEHIWKNIGEYFSKRCLKYNWIVNRSKDLEKSEVEVYVWWDGKGVFSATPLRSYLKRLKKKNHKECFKISKAVKTKSILRKLIDSTKTHYWDDGFIGKELMEYLKVGILGLKKKPKAKQQNEPQPSTSQQSDPQPNTTEVTEQEPFRKSRPFQSFLAGPHPTASQQSDPQPTTKMEVGENESDMQGDKTKMDTEVGENKSSIKGDKKRPRLSQNQINGLVLKLLSRTTSNVTSVSKNITGVSDELKGLSEAFCTEMIKVNSKMDKLAEQLYHKLYDPLFDGDCKCKKCVT